MSKDNGGPASDRELLEMAAIRGAAQNEQPQARQTCRLGVGCDEAGICYAEAHGQPDRCGSIPSAAAAIGSAM